MMLTNALENRVEPDDHGRVAYDAMTTLNTTAPDNRHTLHIRQDLIGNKTLHVTIARRQVDNRLYYNCL